MGAGGRRPDGGRLGFVETIKFGEQIATRLGVVEDVLERLLFGESLKDGLVLERGRKELLAVSVVERAGGVFGEEPFDLGRHDGLPVGVISSRICWRQRWSQV